MIKTTLLYILILFYMNGFSQNTINYWDFNNDSIVIDEINLTTLDLIQKTKIPIKNDIFMYNDMRVYLKPEISAKFQIENIGIKEYISTNLTYPKYNKIQPQIIVNFMVTKCGKIKNVGIRKALWGGLDSEYDLCAIKLIKEMPNWINAIDENKPVDSYILLLIDFGL